MDFDPSKHFKLALRLPHAPGQIDEPLVRSPVGKGTKEIRGPIVAGTNTKGGSEGHLAAISLAQPLNTSSPT